MNTIDLLAAFFGWSLVINAALLIVVVIFTAVANKNGFPFDLLAKIFGITKEEVRTSHFRVFQQFRVAILMLNITPYIALKIIS